MRIEVEAGGYDSAAEALLSANQAAAIAYNGLRSKLSGFHALGGDDTSSEEFVKHYDDAAADAVKAIDALVDALANVGAAATTSGANHRQANADSVFGGRASYDGGDPGDHAVSVSAFTPPTSLGGDNADMPDWWNHVVDHLQGWGWPSANTDQLRDAASAWRNAAGAVEALSGKIGVASSMLAAQRSPEIEVATTVLADLDTNIGDLAAELTSLGDACESYAAQVDETRQTIKDLCRDLAIECGVTAGAGVVLSFVTLGGAAVVGAGVIAVRAARYAKLVMAALRGLRAAKAVSAVAASAPRLLRVRNALEKLKRARRVVSTYKTSTKGNVVGRSTLQGKQAQSLRKYEKKLPSKAEDTVVRQLPDGSVTYTTKVPGNAPGSYAVYSKVVDEAGTTVGYVKTTYLPNGKIAHIKDKMLP